VRRPIPSKTPRRALLLGIHATLPWIAPPKRSLTNWPCHDPESRDLLAALCRRMAMRRAERAMAGVKSQAPMPEARCTEAQSAPMCGAQGAGGRDGVCQALRLPAIYMPIDQQMHMPCTRRSGSRVMRNRIAHQGIVTAFASPVSRCSIVGSIAEPTIRREMYTRRDG
jgi:hypothetical protein